MPYGDNDWLALTQETTLEPDLPICDPHHHFWDFRDVRIPYQRYLLDELNSDVYSGHNIRSTVFIETRSMYKPDGPDDLKPVGEIEFVQGLAAASASGIYGPTRAAAAIIGNGNLNLGEKVQPVLESLRLASPNRFQGIRQSCGWDPNPDVETRAPEQQLANANFRKGAQVLANMGLSLDITVYFHQLEELADFAKSVPELTIILNHIGGLYRIGPYANKDNEVLPHWREGIRKVSECENIVLKLGGIGQPRYGFLWHTYNKPINSETLSNELAPLINYCIDQFTPARCMFESNFPPDKVSYSYNILFNAFKLLSKQYSDKERADLFHDTATRIYKIAT